MSKIQKRYIAITLSVLLTLTAITATALALTKQSEPPTPNQGGAYIPLVVGTIAPEPTVNAKEIIKLTNDYRATKGLDLYAENEMLNQSACAKAQHMVDNNYWSHVAPDGTQPWYFFEAAGYHYKKAGENLAYNQLSSKQVVDNWIASSKHNENLLSTYVDTGVCVIDDVLYQGGNTVVIVAHYATHM